MFRGSHIAVFDASYTCFPKRLPPHRQTMCEIRSDFDRCANGGCWTQRDQIAQLRTWTLPRFYNDAICHFDRSFDTSIDIDIEHFRPGYSFLSTRMPSLLIRKDWRWGFRLNRRLKLNAFSKLCNCWAIRERDWSKFEGLTVRSNNHWPLTDCFFRWTQSLLRRKNSEKLWTRLLIHTRGRLKTQIDADANNSTS